MYETGTAVTVHALHVMPGHPPPEGDLHGHDYRLEAVVHGGLDRAGMVVDLDELDRALCAAAAQVDGHNLNDTIVSPDVPAVTVEVFARWLHQRLAESVHARPATVLAVRVWESPTAFGGYTAPLA